MSKQSLFAKVAGAIATLSVTFVSPAQAQIRQVTSVETTLSDDELVIELEIADADQVTVLPTYVGNVAIFDLLVTQLSEAIDINRNDPINGVELISVEPLDRNSVRIRIIGAAGVPTVDIDRGDAQIVLRVTPASLPRQMSCRHCPAPEYPASALQNSVEGLVILRVHFDAEGYVTRAIVERSSGNAAVDQAALDAVWNYEFDLQGFNGQGGSLPIELQFSIQQE